ncbi:hypothetical protein HDU76_007242 [Blyttiomyces sp. JEL0837]|nr:hypothetical protein HDU76_007242 [Blyttiomyces sp. JEL0837]
MAIYREHRIRELGEDEEENVPLKGLIKSADTETGEAVTATYAYDNHSITKTSKELEGCDLLSSSLFDARESFRGVLPETQWTGMTTQDVLEYYNMKNAKDRWLKLRQREMDLLVRERYKDPNLDIEMVREAGVDLERGVGWRSSKGGKDDMVKAHGKHGVGNVRWRF